jgi:hypothetical protein
MRALFRQFWMRGFFFFIGATLLLSSCANEEPQNYKASEIPAKEYSDISKHVAKLMDDSDKSRVYLNVRTPDLDDHNDEMKIFRELGLAEHRNGHWFLTQKAFHEGRECGAGVGCWDFEVARMRFVKLAWLKDIPVRIRGSGGYKWYYIEIRSIPTTELGRLFAKSGLLECLSPEIGGVDFLSWRGSKTAGSALYAIIKGLPNPYEQEDLSAGCPDMKEVWEKNHG